MGRDGRRTRCRGRVISDARAGEGWKDGPELNGERVLVGQRPGKASGWSKVRVSTGAANNSAALNQSRNSESRRTPYLDRREINCDEVLAAGQEIVPVRGGIRTLRLEPQTPSKPPSTGVLQNTAEQRRGKSEA